MNFAVKVDPGTWQRYIAVPVKGKAILMDPFTNKGSAFTNREREELDLHGLLPAAVCTIEQQLVRVYENFQAKTTPLERFVYLTSLQDRNETLFYRMVHEKIDEMMPIVYTPVVGEACQKFSHIYRRGRGLYVTYEHRNIIEKVLRNYHTTDPSIIVVTDGERILGLGDQGAGGMGIPIGKLCLYTLCAGVSPYSTLPITLDVGTDNEERLKDPLYLGLRHKRIRGQEYQDFVDRFVAAVRKVYPNVLFQWEDFLKGNAIKQLDRFRHTLPSFNDDVQGTAAVVIAGAYAAMRITKQAMRDQRVVFAGAGASTHGIAALFVSAMVEEGLTPEEARRRIWTCDTKGLVTKARPGLEDFKALYAREVEEAAAWEVADPTRISLEETVANAHPTILIGVSATPGTFTESIVKLMAKLNDRPLVFPLSNPTSKCECTAEDAVRWSDGRAIVATGSPFAPVVHAGQTHRIGQCNNAFVFPGIGLGACVSRARFISDGMFLDAAKGLASHVTPEDLAQSAVYPQLATIRECSHTVACAVVRRAVAEGHADPAILVNLEENVRRAMWFPEYLPIRYEPWAFAGKPGAPEGSRVEEPVLVGG
ncbi:NAD-dependent malic enzyme [Acidobacteria bacterium ACD]|nr:MAG: NAD-dependent malic enzyme [Acidobacteriota bacterium]MCE7958174.1 NAD-dependent malic enzyme [Acidobacteria bacterium ACB2]MDL1948944.1 NAD-dependent malic enzyme [Acidobacteria bacterium ACD]